MISRWYNAYFYLTFFNQKQIPLEIEKSVFWPRQQQHSQQDPDTHMDYN